MKRFAPTLRRLAFTLLGAYLLFHIFEDADFSALADRLKEVSWPLLLAAAALDFGVHLCKALKWGVILLPVKRTRVGNLFRAVTIGVMANNILWLRLDEVVRLFVLGRREKLPKSTVLGSIVVERSLDFTALIVCLFLSLALWPFDAPPWLEHAGVVAGCLLALGGAAMVVSVRWSDRIASLAGRLPGRLGREGPGMVENYTEGLRAFPGGWRLVKTLLLAASEWSLTVTLFALVALSLGFTLSPSILLLLVVAAYTSFGIPSTPGSVGIYEAFLTHVLTALAGVKLEAALAFVLLSHALLVLPVSVVGLAFLWDEDIGLFELGRLRRREAGGERAQADEEG